MSDQPTPLQLAALVEEAVKALVKQPPNDTELADVIGTMDRAERMLKETRLSWERVVHELEPIPVTDRKRQPKRQSTRERAPVAQGGRYELVPKTKTVRSYNFPAVVTDVQRVTEWETLRTLLELNRADALRFSFQWTNLKKFLSQHRVPLRLAYVEVSDDDGSDGFMVGEVEVPNGVRKKWIADNQEEDPT